MKNLSKYITIVSLIFGASIIAPQFGYACSKKSAGTEHSSSKKEHLKKALHKSGCNDKSCKRCKDGGNCEGACKHNSCRCSNSSNSLNLPIPLSAIAEKVFNVTEKHKFGYKECYYSSGFFSIWQPPKIS